MLAGSSRLLDSQTLNNLAGFSPVEWNSSRPLTPEDCGVVEALVGVGAPTDDAAARLVLAECAEVGGCGWCSEVAEAGSENLRAEVLPEKCVGGASPPL
mmetsp:Transcript_10674/g.21241  ORF Transcript_10674/g.21241 Transcript_10674/m.21241 type:complete len:99 (-) Transcript_10674:43-339(-)